MSLVTNFRLFWPKKGSRFKSQRAAVAMSMATPRLRLYRVYYRPVAGATVENLIIIPFHSDLCEWLRLSQSYQLIKQSILAAIAELLIFLLCRGDLVIPRLLPPSGRVHCWKPHPYTILKQSMWVDTAVTIISADKTEHFGCHSRSAHFLLVLCGDLFHITSITAHWK